MDRFDAFSGAVSEPASSPRKHTNGASPALSSNSTPEPSHKDTRRSPSTEDADARLAAQLQAQENKLARGRATRGGEKPAKKKAPRKKSAKKVKAEDDSDVDGSGDVKPKRKAGGGFQKPFALSAALQELTGHAQVCLAYSK